MKFSGFIHIPQNQLKEAENIFNDTIKEFKEIGCSIKNKIKQNDFAREYGIILYNEENYFHIFQLKEIVENIIEKLKIIQPCIITWAYNIYYDTFDNNVFSGGGGGLIKKLGHEIISIDINEYLEEKLEKLKEKYIIPSVELPKPITNLKELEIKEYYKVFINTLEYKKTSDYRINNERGIIDDLIFHNEEDAIQWIEWFKKWKNGKNNVIR